MDTQLLFLWKVGEIIAEDLEEAVTKFFLEKTLPQPCTFSILALILKKTEAYSFNDQTNVR